MDRLTDGGDAYWYLEQPLRGPAVVLNEPGRHKAERTEAHQEFPHLMTPGTAEGLPERTVQGLRCGQGRGRGCTGWILVPLPQVHTEVSPSFLPADFIFLPPLGSRPTVSPADQWNRSLL